MAIAKSYECETDFVIATQNTFVFTEDCSIFIHAKSVFTCQSVHVLKFCAVYAKFALPSLNHSTETKFAWFLSLTYRIILKVSTAGGIYHTWCRHEQKV